MLVAYLRGYLKPDYAFGLRSVIRENFILSALSRELDAQEVSARIQMEAGYIAAMGAAQANKVLKHHDKMLSLAFSNFRHESARKRNALIDVGGVDKFIELYKDLAKQGIVGIKQNGL